MRYLETKVEDSSDADVVEQWQRNQALMRQQLLVEVGPADGQRKINDFMALEAAPWSVVAQHTHFLHQTRISFVAGAYYPCLTASGALGERILNQAPQASKSCNPISTGAARV
jgi:hypothetical protein